ncbi:MAG TPA: cell division protein, partial [Pseudomonas sp.]|nr:cell division protein [Pseudomonas sp.]
MVGALVLIALAVIFVPMLFNREDDARRVEVDAPAMPQTPAMPDVEVQPVEVPEPAAEPFPEEFEIIEEGPETEAQVPAEPITAPPAVAEPTPT